MCGLTVTSWGNPAEGIGWLLPPPLSSWRLDPYGDCFMDGGRTLLDSEVTEPSLRSCGLLFSWRGWSLTLFACWPFSTVLSGFWQSVYRDAESVWVPFPLGLLELCQLAYSFESLLDPSRLAPSQSASLCVFRLREWVVRFSKWSMLWLSTFCLLHWQI